MECEKCGKLIAEKDAILPEFGQYDYLCWPCADSGDDTDITVSLGDAYQPI